MSKIVFLILCFDVRLALCMCFYLLSVFFLYKGIVSNFWVTTLWGCEVGNHQDFQLLNSCHLCIVVLWFWITLLNELVNDSLIVFGTDILWLFSSRSETYRWLLIEPFLQYSREVLCMLHIYHSFVLKLLYITKAWLNLKKDIEALKMGLNFVRIDILDVFEQ